MLSLSWFLDTVGLLCLFILFLFLQVTLFQKRFTPWTQALIMSLVLCIFMLIFGVPYHNIPLSLMIILGLGLFVYWGYLNRVRAELALRQRLKAKTHGVEWTKKGFIFEGRQYIAPYFIQGKSDYFLAHFFIIYPDKSEILYSMVFHIQSRGLAFVEPAEIPLPPEAPLDKNRQNIKAWKRYHALLYNADNRLARIP